MNNTLMIAGNFDENGGRPSSFAEKFFNEIASDLYNVFDPETFHGDAEIVNGGTYETLKNIATNKPTDRTKYTLSEYDTVFWFPNVSNELDKVRDIKDINPRCMLITSKRNDDNKYNFQELVQRALVVKANLVCEFSKKAEKQFNIRVFDPLGCVYTDTTDIKTAAKQLTERLKFIKNMTRQPTVKSTEDKNLIMKWYFDQFKQNEYPSDKDIPVPDEHKFVEIVRKYATDFQRFMPTTCTTERFIGNASLKPTPVGRCGKGMPSFRSKTDRNIIFVSKRNINKQFIELDNFVPVYLEDGKLYYCGEDKPSVDTPIQVRLYDALPNIKYILHSHCYLKHADFTSKAIPCGAIEEFDEIINFIDETYRSRDMDFYKVNLIGHGSLVMSHDLKNFDDLEYMARTLPETIPERKRT